MTVVLSILSTYWDLRGLFGDAPLHETARRLVGGFRASAMTRVAALAPASLRLQQIEGRATSWRQDALWQRALV